jgi:energy-coupling factor transporter ATP-binding protein EcfA2
MKSRKCEEMTHPGWQHEATANLDPENAAELTAVIEALKNDKCKNVEKCIHKHKKLW